MSRDTSAQPGELLVVRIGNFRFKRLTAIECLLKSR